MLGACLKIAFPHPNPRLQLPWNLIQLGLLMLPLSPLLGLVGLISAVLVTWRRQYSTIIRRRENWGFGILSVLLIITAGFAYDKAAAFLGLFNFLPYFLVFAAYSVLIQTMAQLRQLSWILVITSVPVIFIGLGQLFLGWATSKQWETVLGIFGLVITPGGNPPNRMASVFMYANTLAGYLLIVFILGLGLWFKSYEQLRGMRGNNPASGPTSPRTFLFLTVVVIANFVALILTDSRNAWAIAIFACLVYAVYQRWHILVAGVAGVAASVLLAAFAPLPVALIFRKVVPAFFWARLNDQLYPHRAVASLRTTQWEFAWSLTQQRPWTGWGLRNFTPLYLAHTHEWLGHPHNLFLMLSSETGLPATLLFCSLVGGIFIAGVQLLQKSNIETKDKLILFSYLLVFVALVLFNTVDVSLYDLRLNSLSWLLLSAICGAVYRYNRHELLADHQN
ncbi:MAG: O-antigen ligase family protein [Stigonema ocellatum SAG 48.90 = DSM 106950]|nr:O-antigen ligase family protein [Stigonema ocellatum SAG 48.90 = DSM 106950]